MKRIVVIGGGASGIVAAIEAARTDRKAKVYILEQKEKLGKKILATGNGRCNLTNLDMTENAFRGDSGEIVTRVLQLFDQEQTLNFFSSLGLVTKCRDTYVYPRSDQAQTVVMLLEKELERLGVFCITDVKVEDILPGKSGFRIQTTKETLQADKVILACGGKADSALGSDGSGYALAKSLGHCLSPVVPALVPLKVKKYAYSKASGVRTDAKVTAIVNGKVMAEDVGELQMTAYGISGIPVFQISRYIAKGLQKCQSVSVKVDFLPEYTEQEVMTWIRGRVKQSGKTSVETLLLGMFNRKLVPEFLKRAKLKGKEFIGNMSDTQWKKLVQICKREIFEIEDTMGFERAQVCAGGVKTKEVHPETLESDYVNGLYITGELLDVEGICGGYNLQWAWATGYLAGKDAAK